MKRILIVVSSLVVLSLGAGYVWLRLAPRPTPKGQLPLTILTETSFATLREAFNGSTDRTRVVALLSPT
ncbi:MAG: hypothetical protein ACHQM4_08340 [Thermoanaerobaculia bacterium]